MFRLVTFLIAGVILTGSAFAQDQAQESNSVSLIPAAPSRPIFDNPDRINNHLYEALEVAYKNNPTLRAARAELLAVKEQLPQAEAGFKPTITADADVTFTNTDTKGTSFITSDGDNTSKSGSLNLSQPIFRGGSTIANIDQAKNIITAQNLALSATEQSLLYDVAAAYMNVLRDQAVLGLNENNRLLVSRELEQARNRFTVGELTRTDVSQSEARLAKAEADVINAHGAYKTAIATYRQLVGAPPAIDMGYPEKALSLPETLDDALSIAQTNNRMVLQAKFINAAAEAGVDSVFGELLPQVKAIGRLDKTYDASDFIDEQRQSSIGLSASIPLYQAGSTRSRLREAKKRANQRYIQILEAENQAKQETISNWEALKAAKAETKARESQVQAALIANEGVHYEEEYGERTTLDALDSNQELLDAQVSLITAKRNEVVASFALAKTLGLLVPQNLGFSTVNP
ncbi:MAG TPA: TolC family outer membrane protein [Alphaproteobacteria bacterium]|nr:TolC family outer membrane protein [Alphaproteobacteria bacterium]